ncbi:MAG: sugar phosphate isomerase/epimerase [Lachnospiraceae bacterium]|nr:sugar phosphate isomerase/epimerase [Candidatus Minthocola equi]
MNKYSLVHLTSAGSSPAELIRMAAKTGFDCVGLRGIPTRTNEVVASVKESITGKKPFGLADSKEILMETKLASENEGIAINDVENARIFDGVDVKNYEKDLEAVAYLGIHEVLTNIWTNDEAFYTEKYIELCELARKYDININLEIVTWSAIPGLKEAKRLLDKANQSNQGIVLDTIHFYRSRNTLADLEGLPKEWFRYLHLCDAPKEIPTGDELIRTGLEERFVPGEGAVDIKGIVTALPNAVRGLEIPNKKRIEEMGLEAYLRDALRKTKEYLGD